MNVDPAFSSSDAHRKLLLIPQCQRRGGRWRRLPLRGAPPARAGETVSQYPGTPALGSAFGSESFVPCVLSFVCG
jgi:hypothetical protein